MDTTLTDFIKFFKIEINKNKLLKDKIVGVYLYGSVITNEMNEKSDVDCYVFADDINIKFLKILKNTKNLLEKKIKREVFINIKCCESLKQKYIDTDTFSHRERPNLFIYEAKNIFKLVYGYDVVKKISCPKDFKKNLQKECIRIVRNFQYMNYKLITNVGTPLYHNETIFKNILFTSRIFNIYINDKICNYKESTKILSKEIKSKVPKIAYSYLKENSKSIANKNYLINNSIDFYNKTIELMQKQ